MPAVVQTRVASRRGAPDSGVVLFCRAPAIAAACRPGQFVMAGTSDGTSIPDPLLKRALAVYDLPGDATADLALLLKVVGDGTRRLAGLRDGDGLELIGPLGNGFDLDAARGRHNVIVAGGTGIASVFLLARQLAARGERVSLLYGARREADLAGLEDFESIDVDVTCTTEDGSRGRRGLVIEPLEELLGRESDAATLFTCGPNPMMQAVTRLAADAGVPCQLSVEAKMACGFGVCLGCSVQTRDGLRLSCTHGPVFDAESFVWEPATDPEPIAS